jgi:hypothetical protein
MAHGWKTTSKAPGSSFGAMLTKTGHSCVAFKRANDGFHRASRGLDPRRSVPGELKAAHLVVGPCDNPTKIGTPYFSKCIELSARPGELGGAGHDRLRPKGHILKQS